MRLIGGILSALLVLAPMAALAGPVTLVDGQSVQVGTIGNPLYTTATGGGSSVSVTGPLGRSADAASVSTALSTEDVAILNAPIPTQAGTVPIGGAGALVNLSAGTIIQATTTNAITSTSATTTRIITLSGSTKTYITHYELVVSGAGTVNFISGTGGTCGTNTAFLTGATGHPLSFAANGGISAGSGLGPIMIAAAGQEVCIVTTGAVDTSGVVAFAQF